MRCRSSILMAFSTLIGPGSRSKVPLWQGFPGRVIAYLPASRQFGILPGWLAPGQSVARRALRSGAGLFQFGADVPQFREEHPAGDLLQIADPGGAACAALLADDARDDLEMAVAP